VLYELLTGRPVFEGKSAASVMAAILEREPKPVSALLPRVPELVDATIRKCLAKNPDERWQSAADLATVLRWAMSATVATEADTASAGPPTRTRASSLRIASWILLAAAVGALGSAIVRYRQTDPPPPRPMRFEIQPPSTANWSPAPVSSTAQMALSPNGEHLAFVAAASGSRSRIWIRDFRTVEARELADTDGAAFPFWSPDNRFIAFFADGKLKKVDISGGRPQVLANAPAGRGGTWAANGIVFTPAPSQGLFLVSAEGGASAELTSAGSMGAITHYWPQFLPDGDRVLFYQRSGKPELQGIYVVDVRTKSVRPVMVHDGRAIFADGRLLTVRDGMLFAQRVDEASLTMRGEPVRIADSVGYFGGTFGDASVTVSNNGVLAYGPRIVLPTSLQWRDRSGRMVTRVTSPGGSYRSPLLTSDGKTVVFSLLDPTRNEGPDVWMADLGRDSILTRLTTDPRNDWFPVWSSDGSHLFFGSTRAGSTGLFRKTPSGSAPDEPLTEPTQFGRYPTDVSRDGKTLVYHEVAQEGYDLGLIETNNAGTPRKFLATRFNEVQGRLSPDQRWMAYASDESGRFEVYVRRYPDGANQSTLSIAGGMQPRWRADGRELFYLEPDGQLMAVSVITDGPAFEAAAPRPLFTMEVPEPSAPFPTDYDVSADGQRFLANIVVDQASRPSVKIVLNWTTELERN
jgi:Tol biopolymer transport system component